MVEQRQQFGITQLVPSSATKPLSNELLHLLNAPSQALHLTLNPGKDPVEGNRQRFLCRRL